MRESLEKKYQENRITEEEKPIFKKQILIKKIILEVIFLLMVIFSFVKMKRIGIFYNALGGGTFSFYTVAVVLYFIGLFAVFFYTAFQITYIVLCIKNKGKDWLPFIHLLDVKGDLYAFIAKCLSILLFIMIYITTPCTVVGQSMEDTFQSGDRVLCSDLFYKPKKNDVIVFDADYYEVGYINDDASDTFYIKRIVAIPGDTLSYNIDEDMCYINAEACSDITLSNYNTIIGKAGYSTQTYSITIPKDYVLVLGDNRDHSNDSRALGLIRTKDIFGKVFFRVFPFHKLHFY